MEKQEENKGERYSVILTKQIIASKKGENLNFTEKRIVKDIEEFET